jgi:hypothetical protein
MQERFSGRARSKWAAVAAAFALALGFSGLALQSATADSSLPVYDEGDSPNPIYATNALVFYKGADLGWTVDGGGDVTIPDVTELSYTVALGTDKGTDSDYAPSIQLITSSMQFSYARLVWEPYQQDPAQGPITGTFSNVQDGLWWTNKIGGGAPGSQADPQPLSFFDSNADAGWTNVKVHHIAIHQGTTTDTTTLVTNVSYNNTAIPLGEADNTPFDQFDVDGAVDAYAETHHTADGTDLGASRALLSTTPVHGKVVGVTLQGSMGQATSRHYQWYLSGTAVSGATNSTYKVPTTATGKSVSVRVTGTHKYMVFGIHSNTVKAK